MRSIFHAHNWSFKQVQSKLVWLKDSGFDGIQLSPAQKSPDGEAWYLRYQPVDHLVISGLGDRAELKQLCAAARDLNITIIADLVFNHMAVPEGVRRKDWIAADLLRKKGDSSAIDALYSKLLKLPHLTLDDFQPWQDMQGEDWDNDRRYESWGNGEWPELKPTPRVLDLHRQHIQSLYECGVQGFRFDAVKHMRVEHLQQYTQWIAELDANCWSYGEVFSGDPGMHREYMGLFATTDFPFVLYLKKMLAMVQPDLVKPLINPLINPADAFLSPHSIRFGLNHDLILNPFELVSGFHFDHRDLTRLANCLSVLLSGGTALVYCDNFADDPLLRSCVAYRERSNGMSGPVQLSRRGQVWIVDGGSKQVLLDFEKCSLTESFSSPA